MDALVFIALIAWVVLSAVRKKKQREAAEAARRAALEQAAEQAAQSAPPPARPVYSAPIERPASPAPKAQPAFDPFFGGLKDASGTHSPDNRQPSAPQRAQAAESRPMQPPPHASQQPRMQMNMQTNMQSNMADRTTTMHSTLRHALEASSITGHAHTESSITGIEPECPPERRSGRIDASAGAPASAQAAGSAFCWNVGDATRGLVLSEILGKPKALRQ